MVLNLIFATFNSDGSLFKNFSASLYRQTKNSNLLAGSTSIILLVPGVDTEGHVCNLHFIINDGTNDYIMMIIADDNKI